MLMILVTRLFGESARISCRICVVFLYENKLKGLIREINPSCLAPIQLFPARVYTSIAQQNFLCGWTCSIFALSNTAISGYMKLATEHFAVASAPEELILKFYLIFINLNSHTWLGATILDSIALHNTRFSPKSVIVRARTTGFFLADHHIFVTQPDI